MELYTRPRELGELPLGALLMLPLFGLPLGAHMLEHQHVDFGTCAMKLRFQLPCLSCGATRATLRLFHGDLLGALAFQPMMMMIYLALLLWGSASLYGLVTGRRVVMHLSDREDLIFKAIIVGAPALNWLYLYKMGI